jgi:hypothetical protein
MVQELPSHVPPPESEPLPPAPTLPEPPLGVPLLDPLVLPAPPLLPVPAPLLEDRPAPLLPEEAPWLTPLPTAEASEVTLVSTLPPQPTQSSAAQRMANAWIASVPRLTATRVLPPCPACDSRELRHKTVLPGRRSARRIAGFCSALRSIPRMHADRLLSATSGPRRLRASGASKTDEFHTTHKEG